MGKLESLLCVQTVLSAALQQKEVELWTLPVRFLRALPVVITCCGVNVAFHKKSGVPVWGEPEGLLWYR